MDNHDADTEGLDDLDVDEPLEEWAELAPGDWSELGRRVALLDDNTTKLRRAYIREGRKRDKRIAITNRAIQRANATGVLGVAVACIAVLMALSSNSAAGAADRRAERAEAALHAYKSDILVARKNTCHQDNLKAENDREAFISHAQVLVATVENPTPEEVADIAEYLAAQRVRARALYLNRNCTLAGIADYLAGDGRGYVAPEKTEP